MVDIYLSLLLDIARTLRVELTRIKLMTHERV